jgi:phosphoribosylaminoimidazole-succinocarboxamide synthase
MSEGVVLQSNLALPLLRRGKVRDLYDLGEKLLIVSTDRISAFDVVLPTGIPNKGEALNRLSTYWFDVTKDIVPNHILKVVDPRTVIVKKTKPIKVEFIVRGYIYGSTWEKYKREPSIAGKSLPRGFEKAEKLPEPILTPTTKAEKGHDVEMTSKQLADKVGRQRADRIEEICLKIYSKASKMADANGIIVADTKMEFGLIDEQLILIDELLTPDASRFWAKEKYRIGEDQESFDKQYVRDYLIDLGWNKKPPAPQLPENIITETSKRYVMAFELLTGRKF